MTAPTTMNSGLPPLCAVSFGITFLCSPVAAATPDSTESRIRRVADHVLQNTTRRLIDRSTGETFEDSAHLDPKPEISIESKFNAWFYQTWLLTDGMRRAASALGETRYAQYGENNLDFIFRHMPFFEKQQALGMKAAPVGDGVLSPIGFYFGIGSLWHTGLAPLVQERWKSTGDARYEPFLARIRKALSHSVRFEDGLFYRKWRGAMTDDPYMTVPFLVREERLEEAIAQILGTHARLMDGEKQLLRHLWDLKTQQPSGAFWGRGNGWTVLAHVEVLGALPAEHSGRSAVLHAFAKHLDGIRRCQDPSGGWHQVLTQPTSWIETSATGMFVYGLARGVCEGWLPPEFGPEALRGWAALQGKVTQEGDLVDVCGSTNTGDLAYYVKRPRLQGDLHGFGSYLLAGAEIIRLERSALRSNPESNPAASPSR